MKEEKVWRPLFVGDEIYVPSVREPFVGGLAKITRINGNRFEVKEHYGLTYRWIKARDYGGLADRQDELKEHFGNQRAYTKKCPSAR